MATELFRRGVRDHRRALVNVQGEMRQVFEDAVTVVRFERLRETGAPGETIATGRRLIGERALDHSPHLRPEPFGVGLVAQLQEEPNAVRPQQVRVTPVPVLYDGGTDRVAPGFRWLPDQRKPVCVCLY